MNKEASSIYVAAPEEIPLHKARWVISNWVMPFNATLIFCGTVVAALDFLSPRIAILPFASVAAITLLLALVAARKVLGASLQPGSAARWWLAPDLTLPRSPAALLVALTALLMTAGAVWSNSTQAQGGILASRFDAARSAQESLGILHALRAEQKLQTALLEDIREGRADNPRRQLAAQGMAWSGSGYGDALRRADAKAVDLYLAGGMKWDLDLALKMRDQPDVAAAFLAHPKAFETPDGRVCAWYFEVLASRSRRGETVPNAVDKRFLSSVCGQAKDTEALKGLVSQREKGDLSGEEERRELQALRAMLAS